MDLRLHLTLALLAFAPSCKEEVSSTSTGTQASPSSASVLDREFAFACSPDESVGCSGLFDVRIEDSVEAAVPVSGEDALGARIASLQAATKSIRVQALIFRADESGLYIADLLKARKKDGLDVRVIVDAVSNLDWKTQWMYFDLKQHGIEVEGYEALYLEWLTAEKLLKPWHANKRFHDKMWIIDGENETKRVAIVGGLNLANEYFRVDQEPINRWHDQDIILRGPIVEDITKAFDRNYEFFKGIKTKLPKALNPDNAWKLSGDVLGKIAATKVPTWERAELSAAVEACATRTPSFEFKPAAVRFLQSRPRMKETFILQSYLNLIDVAKQSISIANAYFIPSREVVEALRRAAERGVKVTVVTNSPESNDIASVALVSRYIYKDLLAESPNGIEIYEWIGPSAGEGTLHAKYALFDGHTAIVGSYNLDPRSERLNSETAVALRDPALVGQLETRYRTELVPKSRQVGWQDALSYRRPEGVRAKFKLLFAVPMKEWL